MNERHWEINGNLDDSSTGLKNYFVFHQAISKVKKFFDDCFGEDLLNKIDFYVDNAAQNTGYIPITTVVLKKIAIVKLGIGPYDTEVNAAFQFAHELMHIVCRAVWGMDKPKAEHKEESICSAAALITVKMLYPGQFEVYKSLVCNLKNMAYREGANVAELIKYDIRKLMPLVISLPYQCNNRLLML